jgi:hypothetical protein
MAGITLAAGAGLILIAMFRNGCANDGIRFMIWRQVLAVDGLYVGLPDIAILGLVFSICSR